MNNFALNDRALKIITFMLAYESSNRQPPSIREIMDKTTITSTSVVNWYFDRLAALKLVKRSKKKFRGTRLTPAGEALARISLNIKDAACPHCGAPIGQDGKYKDKRAKADHIQKNYLRNKPRSATVTAT